MSISSTDHDGDDLHRVHPRMFYDSEFSDVARFHHKFGQIISPVPAHLTERKAKERRDFMQEELDEFWEGVQEQNLDKMFDALLDLVYVAKGTAAMMGLPWAAGWTEVQQRNMAKVAGMTKRGNLVDVTKPPGWTPPDHETILKAAGYVPENWVDPSTHLDDEVHK